MRVVIYLLCAVAAATVCGRVWAPETTAAIVYVAVTGELPR